MLYLKGVDFMLTFGKRNRAKERMVKAYEEYRKVMKEVAEETGWNFNCSCCTSGKADTETERNEFVKMLSDIDKKYNTK